MLLQPPNQQYSQKSARIFATQHGSQGSRILIYRDIETLLKKHRASGKALDFGCGPGFSTRLLASLGFDVVGVDISKEMLSCAFSAPDGIPFAWIKHGEIPFAIGSFDLVLATMVLLEEPTLKAMQRTVNEIYRVLKPEGIFLAVVSSEHMHKYNWTNRSIHNVENNQDLKTGEMYITQSHTSGMSFTNFVYFHSDYCAVFNNSGLELLETHHAFGMDSDGLAWSLEKTLNPFTHYVCQKK